MHAWAANPVYDLPGWHLTTGRNGSGGGCAVAVDTCGVIHNCAVIAPSWGGVREAEVVISRYVLLRCCGVVLSLLGAALVPAASAAASAAASTPGARAAVSAPQAPHADYDWPLAGWPRVSRPFQPPLSTYGPGHRGVDLVATVDTPVLAAGAGTVVFAGELAGRGVVSVLHASGLRTTYEPVTASVEQGAAVQRGQVLGVVQAGHAGCPAQACLHWGLRRGEIYLDPLRLIGRWQVRLKPWVD